MIRLAGSFTLLLVAASASTAALVMATGTVSVRANHPVFSLSSGIYRIPYADGTAVSANNDHHTHPNVLNRVDRGEAMARRSSPALRASSAASWTGMATAAAWATAWRPTASHPSTTAWSIAARTPRT